MIAHKSHSPVAVEAEIISRLLLPPLPSRAAATALLGLDFSAADIKQMKQLSAKARQGKLSEAEEELASAYERIGSLLAVLKSKTRVSLQSKARATKR
jgi:hypothetical protein